jgi:peptidoglycan-associated lipoprotein
LFHPILNSKGLLIMILSTSSLYSKRLLKSALVLLCLFALAACSSKSKVSDDESGLSEADLAAQREGRFGSGSIPMAEGEGMFKDIYFDYDSSKVSDAAMQRIESNVELLKENPQMRVQVEGHTDERGTSDYNMALGSARAKSVRDVMVSLGISSSKIETISYGEELPLDAGQTEMAFAKNRRAHLSPLSR